MANEVDICEDDILKLGATVLQKLLIDHSTSDSEAGIVHNIIWATSDYESLGAGYAFSDEIKPELITGANGKVVMPRVLKSKEQQTARSKDKAEVFTPSWVCNAQNNLIDDEWFEHKERFNTENPDHTWTPNAEKIKFPEGKTWQDYVRDTRLEITCGEAPYLVSRYDTTTGEAIPLESRIGLLDRKLRVVSENTDNTTEWLEGAQMALMSTYGYEWQGDNLLLAREAVLFSVIDYFKAKFGRLPVTRSLEYIAYIVSWNLWQMDGLKFCPPGQEPCEGDIFNPCNLCQIRDWSLPRDKQKLYFKSMLA